LTEISGHIYLPFVSHETVVEAKGRVQAESGVAFLNVCGGFTTARSAMSTRGIQAVRRCLENIWQRERLITRRPAGILSTIALFVLLVGKLEERMRLLVRVYGRKQHLDRMTFGMAVGEVEAILKRSMSRMQISGRDE